MVPGSIKSARTSETRSAVLIAEIAFWSAVVVQLVIIESVSAVKFKTAPRLSKDAIDAAEFFATRLWTGPHARYWWDSFTEGSIPAMPWYRKIDLSSEPRYDALALLLITRPNEKPIANSDSVSIGFEDTGTCSAFYIAPGTLMTVAHCLTDVGMAAGSGHIIIARQNYVAQRDKEYTKALADKYERIVVEWIYEAAYSKATPVWSADEAMDYAFLKIKGTSHNNAHFVLAPPKSTSPSAYDYIATHAGVLLAGFPGEWSKFNEPAEVQGILHYSTDDAFLNEPAIQREKAKFKRDPTVIRDNQVAAVSHGKGTMGHGGSGGPWLISEASLAGQKPALTGEQKSARLKWVVGMALWSSLIPTEKQMPGLKFDERQKFATVAVSKLFSDSFVAMAKEIVAIKDGAKTMQAVMEKHIK